MSALTTTEIGELERLESIIEEGQEGFLKTGAALSAIRDRKLYRRDFDTFEVYCQKRWKFSKGRAFQLIDAALVVKALPPNLSTIVDNEGQARALAKVPEAKRAEVLSEVQSKGAVTAKAITEVADAEPSVTAERLDAIGRVIPPDMLPDWDRAAEVGSRLRSCAQEIKLTVERGIADRDIIFGELTNHTASEAASLRYTLTHIDPYAVCPSCQGKIRENCQFCKRRGWISKYMFESPAVDEAKKALLRKVKK